MLGCAPCLGFSTREGGHKGDVRFSHILIIVYVQMPLKMHVIRMVRVMYHLAYSSVSTGA